jgi:HEAT repeat protein
MGMKFYPLLLALTQFSGACRTVDEPSAGGKPVSFWKKEARQVSLMTFWNSDRDERRHEAFRRLSEIGAPAVPALVDLFEENGIAASGDAFNALANLGPRAASAVPRMRALLKNENPNLQRRAAWILGTIGPAAEPAVPDLVRLVQLPDPRLREVAAKALSQIGGAGRVALENALSSSDAGLREAAVSGMTVQPLDSRSRQLLIARGLADPNPLVRTRTVELFHRVKREDTESMGVHLVKALDDTDPRVRRAAEGMLTGYLQGQRTTPRFLAIVLTARNNSARAEAAWRLADTGFSGDSSPRDPSVDDALVAALSDVDTKVRVYAARALLDAGGALSRQASRVLRRELPNLPPILRVRAARALWDTGQRVEDVTDAYQAGLDDPEKWNRVETISAIAHMGIKGKTFVPQLERLLEDPDPEVRDRAKKILYSMRLQKGDRSSRLP